MSARRKVICCDFTLTDAEFHRVGMASKKNFSYSICILTLGTESSLQPTN